LSLSRARYQWWAKSSFFFVGTPNSNTNFATDSSKSFADPKRCPGSSVARRSRPTCSSSAARPPVVKSIDPVVLR
jgi:hypothetical protein